MSADSEKLRELTVQKENVQRVSKLVSEEVQTLKEQCDRERENTRIIKMEAARVSLQNLPHFFLCIIYELERKKKIQTFSFTGAKGEERFSTSVGSVDVGCKRGSRKKGDDTHAGD